MEVTTESRDQTFYLDKPSGIEILGVRRLVRYTLTNLATQDLIAKVNSGLESLTIQRQQGLWVHIQVRDPKTTLDGLTWNNYLKT